VDGNDEIVEMRCYQFGGIARVVLAEDVAIIEDHVEHVVENALATLIETGSDEVVSTLFTTKRSRFESAHTLIGVATRFHEPDLPVSQRYKPRKQSTGGGVVIYPDKMGREFLQLPVDWLSRPLREMGFQSLVRRHDLANMALPFGSWPAGAQGIFNERFTFNRIVLAAEAGQPVFDGLHRIKAASRARGWRPQDLSADTQRDNAGVHAERRYVRLPNRPSDSFHEMRSVLAEAIEEAFSVASDRALLLVPTSDTCPVFDGILLLGGAPVEVLFVQVTLQHAHGVSLHQAGAQDFFEAALGVARDRGDDVRVAIVYVLGPSNYDSFSAQEQQGTLARRVAQYKARASPLS
jgi:hypothetical protein